MNISKSKYMRYCQCPKMLWMDVHKPEEGVKDESAEARFKEGHEVGELAKGLFGDFVECSARRPDGSLNISVMLSRTREAVSRGIETICEAAFSVYGMYCAVDILHKTPGGYAVYEVKSSTAVKEENLWDMAFQKHVLRHCRINVTGTYILHVNNQYVRRGDIDLSRFFVTEDVSEAIEPYYEKAAKTVAEARKCANAWQEPQTEIGLQCRHPYACPYWTYCMRTPSPNVFDVYRIREEDAFAMYNAGVRTMQDIYHGDYIDDTMQGRQVRYANENLPMYTDKDSLREFLSRIKYPLYFLDFETFMTCIPAYDGIRPYQQVPFQYSLHILESEGAPLVHREFLAEEGKDPRRAIAESLVENIPEEGTLLAYYKIFECSRIQELAETFPDLADRLLRMADRFVDLLEPFQSGWVYNREMGGSFSIKSVLPALFPDDPELNYLSLDEVHNGLQATSTYQALLDMPPAEREKARENLLKYCCLDSYGMVRIWQKLQELSA